MKLNVISLGVGLAFLTSCAGPTYTLDPHPDPGDPEHGEFAYQAEDGGIDPATGSDALYTAGAAALDTALGLGGLGMRSGGHRPTTIQGHCEIVNSRPTLPCSLMVLSLDDVHGQIVADGRTDGHGNFIFSAKTGEKYLLVVQSPSFLPRFSPEGPFKAGDFVRIRLRDVFLGVSKAGEEKKRNQGLAQESSFIINGPGRSSPGPVSTASDGFFSVEPRRWNP